MEKDLRKNIKATVTYYDVLDFPLTTFEVWKFLMNYMDPETAIKPVSLAVVAKKLVELENSDHVHFTDGMWHLPGRSDLVMMRIAREKISIMKLKGMRRLVALLRYLPFIQMIAATGSLSLRHGNRLSDWDMFVVMKEGRLFIGRTLLTIFLHGIGKRRHHKKIVDRACLNCYVTEDALLVESQDWYSAHEYQVMIPLFQKLKIDSFYRANGWMTMLRPHHFLPLVHHKLTLFPTKRSQRTQKFLERIFNLSWLEQLLSSWQIKKIQKNPKTKIAGSFIVAHSRKLVFFPVPRGPKVFEAFHKRLSF